MTIAPETFHHQKLGLLGGKCRPCILSNSFAYGGDASGVKTRLQHLQDRFHYASWQPK
jgi:hypothetical protein